MIDINSFISEYITKRPVSMFAQDIESNKEELLQEIQGKKVLVIGGSRYNRFIFYKSNITF